jgi:hypothetical protein
MKMLPALFLCLTIVAGFPLRSLAAGPIAEDAPVTAEVAAVARLVEMDPSRDRARFMTELTRLLHTHPSQRTPALKFLGTAKPDPARAPDGPPPRVPVPLTAGAWSRAVFRRPIDADQLIAAIISDRRASLLCHALAALDDETLEFLSQRPDVLTRLYDESAAPFGAFGASLRIRAGRVVPPGGDAAIPLWEGVLGETVGAPDRFVTALFGLHGGRLAYLYDTIAQLEAPNAAFALGLWIDDPAARLTRFVALAETCTGSYREWNVETMPFSKPLHDLATLLMRMRVEPSGSPAAPADRSFWSEVFGKDDLQESSVTLQPEEGPIDAAWLANATSGGESYWRGDRLEQFAFGQRVFSDISTAQWTDAIVAIRGFPRQRMLSLALEAGGIRTAAIHALAVRRANQISTRRANRAFWTLAQLQSALAQVLRMLKVGTVDPAVGEALVASLCAVPLDDGGRYSGAMALWVERELVPRLPPGASVDSRLITALAGPAGTATRVLWEGQEYQLDLTFAERTRIELVRAKQVGYSIDLALDLHAIARTLAADRLTVQDLRAAVAKLSALAETHGERFDFQQDMRALGVDEPRPARETVAKAVEELTKSTRDPRRAARVASTLDDLVDVVLGDALLSVTYAAELGDPEGSATLARNVAIRHDFGFSRRDAENRARTAWAIPKQDFLPGVPWHVTGSVLGLDIALAPLGLRRTSLDRLPDAPKLPSYERDAFALSVALMNPRRLHDRDLDAIRAAIGRGRLRVAAVASGGEALGAVADAIALDGWRRREVQWMLVNDRGAIPESFSLAELLVIGGGDRASLDAWGTTALSAAGCACTRLAMPRTWRLLSGRPQVAPIAAGVADLNLHVALTLSELGLPAALARAVLSAAALDFIEVVAPKDPEDWLTVARAAQSLPRERIEDYIAAAAAVDGPLVARESIESDLGPTPDR